jgi:hypothetical protein
MPAKFEKKVKAQGGAIRWRSKSVKGHLFRIAVTKKKGPHGGRTVAYRVN